MLSVFISSLKCLLFLLDLRAFYLAYQIISQKYTFFFFFYYFPNSGSPLCLTLKHTTCHNLCLSTDTIKLFYCCSALLKKEGHSCLCSVPHVFLFSICSQYLKELSAKRGTTALSPSVSCPQLCEDVESRKW